MSLDGNGLVGIDLRLADVLLQPEFGGSDGPTCMFDKQYRFATDSVISAFDFLHALVPTGLAVIQCARKPQLQWRVDQAMEVAAFDVESELYVSTILKVSAAEESHAGGSC